MGACVIPSRYRLCSLMDKAFDYESKDCRFESCQSHQSFYGSLGKPQEIL